MLVGFRLSGRTVRSYTPAHGPGRQTRPAVIPMRRATLVLLAHAASASGSSDFAAGVRTMPQVAAAEAQSKAAERYLAAVTYVWKLAGEVTSTTPSTSTLTIRREDPTSIPCTETDFYLYVRKAVDDTTLLAHSDGGSTLTLEVNADVASVQAFLQCGLDVVYNEIDVAALRADYLAAEEAERIRLERERKEAAEKEAAEKEAAEKEAANLADTSSDVSSDSSSGEVLGLALGLGFGIALCLLCVAMLIFFIRRKREAPAAPQIVLPPPGAGDDGRASIGRAYYEQHGMTMTEAIRNKV